MAEQVLTKTWAQVDSATADVLALLAASGLAKDIRLANGNKLQGLTVGAALVDMAHVNAADELVYGEAGADIVMISDGVLVSATGTATGAPGASADDLVIDGTGTRGLSIISANDQQSNINLGDPDDTAEAVVRYSNAADVLSLIVGGAAAQTLDANQNVSTPNGNFTASGGFLGYGAHESLTISGGIVTATKSTVIVDTEGAAAADDLVTINGGTAGDILVFGQLAAGKDITIKDAGGNIRLSGSNDLTLTSPVSRVTFIRFGTAWYEIGRSID